MNARFSSAASVTLVSLLALLAVPVAGQSVERYRGLLLQSEDHGQVTPGRAPLTSAG